MANNPNPFFNSASSEVADELQAKAALINQQNAALAQPPAPAPVAPPVDQPVEQAPQPLATPAARAKAGTDDYLPPPELRPVFEASAKHFDVPVNILMAIGHQESRYRADAVGQPTKYGTAKGMMQNLDSTAKGLGINAMDPNEAIPAAAKQIRERLDKGATLEDAVKEHFAGPDRTQWGEKTARYGVEVMDTAGRIGTKILGETPAAAEQDPNANRMGIAQPRAEYEQTFRANNPTASPAAVKMAMAQYDTQKAARGQQKIDGVAQRFDTLKSPEATFDARLNQKLAGDAAGVVPALPGKLQPAPPAPAYDKDRAERESEFSAAASYLGKSFKSGVYDLMGAGAKVLDEVNPFTITPQQAATLFKDDPKELRRMQDESVVMVLSRFAKAMSKNSEESIADISDRAKRDYGDLEYATTDTDKAAYLSPVKVIGDALRSLPTSAAMAVSVYLTRGAAATAERTALAAGMSAEAAKQAGIAAGARTMATAGAASEGTIGYAQQALSSAADAAKVPQAELERSPKYQRLLQEGYTPQTAREQIIADTGEQAGKIAGIVDAAVNQVGGQFLGKIISEGGKLIPRIMKGAANESATEFAQSAGEQVGQNQAIKDNINPDQELSQGVGEAAVAGAAVGGLMGGVMSGVGGRGAAPAPVRAPVSPLAPTQAAPVPAAAVPSAPQSNTPLTSAVADSAAPPARVVVTNEAGNSAVGTMAQYQEDDAGGFTAQIVGDDGQVYTITDQDGVQLAPVEQESGPLSSAVEGAADAHDTAPAEVPTAALAEVAAAQAIDQPVSERESAQPASTKKEKKGAPRQDVGAKDGWINQNAQNARDIADKRGITERIESEFAKGSTASQVRKALASDIAFIPADEQSGFIVGVRATLGIPSQADEDGKKEFATWKAEYEKRSNPDSAQPEEVQDVTSPRNGDGDVGGGSDRPVARNGTDLDGRPGADGPLSGNGRADAAVDGKPDATDLPAASVPADEQPALTDWKKNPYASYQAASAERAQAYMEKKGADPAKFEVRQTGAVRWQVVPKDAAGEEPTVRMYHGGEPGDAKGPLWFSQDKKYAQGYANKSGGRVWYVDVPADHPSVAKDEEFGVLPSQNIELPADIAGQRKLLSAAPKAKPGGWQEKVAKQEARLQAEIAKANASEAERKAARESKEAKTSEELIDVYRGVTKQWDESARGEIEWWTPSKDEAAKYAKGKLGNEAGQVATSKVDGKKYLAVDERNYSNEALNAFYARGDIDGVVVTRDGKPIIYASFNKPAAEKVPEVAPKAPRKKKTAPLVEFDHNGTRIYPVSIKVDGNVVQRWAVESAENRSKREAGDRTIGGDDLLETENEAKERADSNSARDIQRQADKEQAEREGKAATDLAETKKNANRKLTVAERRAEAILDKPHKLVGAGLGSGSRRDAMQKAVEQDRRIEEKMVRDTAAKKRDQDVMDSGRRAGYMLGLSNENIPLVKQMAEANARLKSDNYLKPEYRVYEGRDNKGAFREISKTEYDYAKSIEASNNEARYSIGDDGEYRDEHRAPGREDAAPLSDLTGDGNIYPDDVYSANGARYYGTGKNYDREAFQIASKLRNKPDAEVTIYRAIPSNVTADINPGDWVSITKQYAVDHGESRFDGDYKIITKKVRAGDIFTNGDSIQEWGYDPEDGGKYSIKDGVPQAEFGPVHDEYRDDAAGAVKRLMTDKDGEAIIHRDDVGDISIVYGDGKMGLSHIAGRRGAEFMARLPELLRDGKVYTKPGQADRMFIGTDRDEAVIRFEWDGKAKTWLLSAYEKYPDLKAAGAVQESRRSETVAERSAPAPSVEQLRKSITGGVLGKVIDSMIDAGMVVLHTGPKSLPKGVGANIKGVQAATTPDGKIHLVASNLTAANARAVMLHEAFHEGVEKLLGTEQWSALMGRMGSLYRQGEQSSGKAKEFFDKARKRVAAAKAKGGVSTKMEVEEFAAYAIEEYESAPATVRKWVDDLIAMIKAWMVKRFGKQIGQVTPAQLSAMARWALMDHAVARGREFTGGMEAAFSMTPGAMDVTGFAEKMREKFPGLRLDLSTTYNGDVNLSRVVVPMDQREAGTGTAFMEELTRFADENNVRVVLTPSADFGGNKARLLKFYKRFGFVENKGRNKDFSTMEAMYREPEQGARYSVAGGPTGNELTPAEQGRARKFQELVQDNINRVRQVQKRIEEVAGVPLSERNDYVGAEINRPGRIAARLEDAESHLTGPLMERLAKSGYTQKQLSELLHAMHAEERNEAVAKINPDFPDGGSGMTNDEAQAILTLRAGDAELHAIAKQARDIAKATLDLKLEYGLITAEQHEMLTNSYKNYVPLKGDGEYGPKVKRAMGHDEREEYIVENIARDYQQAVVVGEKNLARQSLLRMVLQNPDPELWTVGAPPKGRFVAGKVYAIMDGNTKVATFTARSQVDAFLEGKGPAASNYTVVDSNGDQVKEFAKPLQDNEVMVYVKGDPVRIQIYDKQLAAQVRPLNQGQMGQIMEFMRGANRYLSKIYTGYNPAFILRNVARDSMTGTINMLGNNGVAVAAKAWSQYPMAVKALGQYAATGKAPAGRIGDLMTEYRMNGGKTGASWMSDFEQQGKTLERLFDDAYGAVAFAKDGKPTKAAIVAGRKFVGGMAHVVEIANQATENALRLSLYIALREKGATPGKAAQAAKSVTVDFDRKGTATGALGALYLFFNPAVQGTANAVKALSIGKHRGQAWAALGGLASLGAYAASAGIDEDKDRWLGEGWDIRTKNLILKIGDKQLRIPLSQEYAPAYALGVSLAEARSGESKMRSAARLVTSFIDAYFPFQGAVHDESEHPGQDFALAMTPTIIKPAVTSAFNRNSFGSQIVPETETTVNRPDNLKMSRGTKNTIYDKSAQGIASLGEMMGAGKYENDITKVSPETLKMLWRTYTGGLGQFVTDTASLAYMGVTDRNQLESGDYPFLKDFVKTPDVKPIQGRYFDLSAEARKAISEFQMAKKLGDGEEIDKITADPTKVKALGLTKMITKTNKAVAELKDEAVETNADTKMSPTEKRARLKELEREQESLYREAIEVFKQ